MKAENGRVDSLSERIQHRYARLLEMRRVVRHQRELMPRRHKVTRRAAGDWRLKAEG